jgi:hypothetical protein
MSTKLDTAEQTCQEKEITVFQKSIDSYIKQINSLIDTMPIIINVLASNAVMHIEKLKTFCEDNNLDKLKDDETTRITFELYRCYEQLNLNTDKAIEAVILYPCNLVVSLVSLYDAYLGNIIKAIYRTTPEQLKDCNREFSINEILSFESIEEAKERAIEKEAETVIRSGHGEQLDWLKRKLKCSFKDFKSYNDFIEITERRNLFVHTNGVVSRQYLAVCEENGVKGLENIKVGDRLLADPDYVLKCYNILFEVGVSLGIVVWRKLKKNDEQADFYLNNVCYELIKQERYELAKIMLNFATETIKNAATEEVRRMFIINKALSYYLSGYKTACITILDKEDWTATASKFQLAVSVLKEDYEAAGRYMESAKSDVNNIAYCEWPLFKNFRESEIFRSEYLKIFGENFQIKEHHKENVDEILQFAIDIRAKANEMENKADSDASCNEDVKLAN